jgi:hypothetical protein
LPACCTISPRLPDWRDHLGNIETLWGYDFDDGSRLWIAHETFRPRDHPDQDWEQTGIIPDLEVIVNWDEYTTENDPAVLAALDYFDGQ